MEMVSPVNGQVLLYFGGIQGWFLMRICHFMAIFKEFVVF